MKISREVKTAVLVISGIVLFVYLYNFLQNKNLFGDEVAFYTEFDYNALTMSSPVTIMGNTVGKIEDIKYIFKTGKTRVDFSVDPRLSFSKSSTVRLYETGIMGGNALAIIDSNEGEPAKKGDFISSEIQPGLINTLKDNFSGLSTNLDKTLRSADTLMVSLNTLVSDDSNEGLKATIAELNSTLKSFKTLSYSIQGVINKNDEKIAETLESFKTTSASFAELSENLKELDLTKTVSDFDKTLVSLQGILASVERGDGTLGKLLKNDSLYNNLDAASKQMELLLLDIKLHPARYRRILSKKEIPYEPPTENQLNNN